MPKKRPISSRSASASAPAPSPVPAPVPAPAPAPAPASHRSKRIKHEARPSSTDPSIHASSAPPKNPPPNSPTDLSTNPSMTSPKGPTTSPSTKLTANTSVNTSTDPLAKSPTSMDPSIQAPADSSVGFNKESTENLTTSTSGDVITDAITEPPMYPRTELVELQKPNAEISAEMIAHIAQFSTNPTLTMKPGYMPTSEEHLNQFDMNVEKVTYPTEFYPAVADIADASKEVFNAMKYSIQTFNPREEILVDEGEVVRFQKVLDEFEHEDPQLPPSVMKEFIDQGQVDQVLERVLSWEIVTNITVDGDLRHTLLPRRLVEIFRDLDCQSTTAHFILSRKWVRMTFGLMKGGLARFRDSDQFLQGLNRIRDFVVKLLGPYFRATNDYGLSFPAFLTDTLLQAMTLGYHILGHRCLYRWDWDWPHEAEDWTTLDGDHSKTPSTDSRPRPGLITSPALLKVSDEQGLPLDNPGTCMAAAVPAEPEILLP